MAKVWLTERWVLLDTALNGLTVEQEDEIARICQEEIAYWKKERNLALGPLGNAVSSTRKHLEEHFSALDSSNSWLNPKKGKQEHISLKHMNLSKEDWAARVVPTQEKLEARLQDRQFITDPDAVVVRAVGLLGADRWQDITVALAVLTGRRLGEILAAGSFTPHTRYTLTFTGQLKVRDKVMPPYEIPTLCEASLILAAVDRLRSLVAGSEPDEDQLGGVADKHFADLVPGRSGGSLYTHLFRAVYGCLAVFFFAPSRILDTVYLNRIYGHYWITEASGKLQADYTATQHYQDYGIADIAVLRHNGQRQGVKLNDEGVELLVVFKDKPEPTTKKGTRKMQTTEETITKDASKTGYSMIKPRQATKLRVDQFIEEEGIEDSSPYDAALVLLLERNYMLKTLLGYGVSLEEVAALLADASSDNENPVKYMTEVLKQKRTFKAGYDARVHGKDYTAMKTSELRKHKAPEAAAERFNRAIKAIQDYNASIDLPEARWYISAAVLVDLVGGSPAGAKAHIETRKAEIDAYHQEHKLTPGLNRRGVPITDRIKVPEGGAVKEAAEQP
jgi:hypothetical protein